MPHRIIEQELIERILFDYMHTSKTISEICMSHRTSSATIYKYLDLYADGARRHGFRPAPEFLVY